MSVKISVVTINLNNKDGLEKTCRSVVSQTVKPYEWIVIDGGSTDGSIDVIKKYEDNLSYWASEPDKGIYNAMNKGIEKVSGEYVQFLNSGDYYASYDVLMKIGRDLSSKSVDFLVGVELWGGKDEIIPPNEVSGAFLFEKQLAHSASFVRTSIVKRNKFDESYRIASDWGFYVKSLLLENSSYASSSVVVSCFDTHGVSTSCIWSAFEEREKIWRTYFGQRVYEDFVRLTSGKTTLEKIVCRVAKYKSLYLLLTALALPVFALYKIRKHF